eukprot:CAMPEP_0176424774 /NCGR_PEP_ID=MMETSP0127-20121128/11024_1 /TAXON_ID=938130 /ORGANISM="Platyophrya macrostoma, Strain WH" /LENGTH=387 /DNA_ID=CAMNT_0017805869 /DNA_START=33 /DNA_END=1196 /DNA_ORIENTATION=+
MDPLRTCFDYDYHFPVDKEVTVLQYIWIGGTGLDVRGKTMIIPRIVTDFKDIPIWNYDGSSTKQASTDSSEVIIKPKFWCPDPFRVKNFPNAHIVLCDTWKQDRETPHETNFRIFAEKIMNEAKDEEPWFGIEQEYIILSPEGTLHKYPIGFPKGGFAKVQGEYYCSAGASKAFGRAVMENHMKASLYAGLKLSGNNAEVFPGQWEFQCGPCTGIEAGDHMWVARYILDRVAEDFGCDITYAPKPIKGDWNGNGCHTNYSTKSIREEGGLDVCFKHMEHLKKYHDRHIAVYGQDNDQRLTGLHETSNMSEFSYGLAHRGASVRIPSSTKIEKKGYYEDRRPAGNCDPYLVTAMLVDSTCLNGKYGEEVVAAYKNVCKLVPGFGRDLQ